MTPMPLYCPHCGTPASVEQNAGLPSTEIDAQIYATAMGGVPAHLRAGIDPYTPPRFEPIIYVTQCGCCPDDLDERQPAMVQTSMTSGERRRFRVLTAHKFLFIIPQPSLAAFATDVAYRQACEDWAAGRRNTVLAHVKGLARACGIPLAHLNGKNHREVVAMIDAYTHKERPHAH